MLLCLPPDVSVAAGTEGVANAQVTAAPAQDASAASNPAADLALARAAVTAKRYDDAIRLLTKVLETPKDPLAKDARELLGLAREKNNQLAHAAAEYRQYLSDYPGGADAARVQQRLDGVIALQNKPLDDLHKAAEENQRKADAAAIAAAHQKAVADAAAAPSLPPAAPVRVSGAVQLVGPAQGAAPTPVAAGWEHSYDGSVGVYYMRNQGSNQILDPLNPGGTTTLNQVYQDTVSTDINLRGRASNATFAATAAISGSQDKSFISDRLDYSRLSQAYLAGEWKDRGIDLKVGRQTHYGGGVLGRFDGAYGQYTISPGRWIGVVAGAPVDQTRDGFMLRNRFFYGLSYGFKLWDPRLDAAVFGIEQIADGALDRRAVGYDLKFTDKQFAMYATLDYDVNFREFNDVIIAGNRTFADHSTFGFNVDYRKSPALFASNAVQGQGTDRLGDLLGRYDYSQIAQYATDRSADTYTASVNYSHPFNEHWQIYTDLYETYTGPTASSAGIDAIPAEGPDTYADVQLIATGLRQESDLYVGGLRLGRSSTSNQYELDLGTKQPISGKWRLSPEAKFGYKTYSSDGHTEFHFLPSLGLNYSFTRSSSLEIDAGGHLTESYGSATASRNWELLLTAGYRYDLYSQ